MSAGISSYGTVDPASSGKSPAGESGTAPLLAHPTQTDGCGTI